jgi:mRNA-degrading endonuclease RelE of RelBE toxin-antitoxin system
MLSDDEYRILQAQLVQKPDAGKIIPGSGGLRKLRWSAGGHGKRGGIRIIYYRFVSPEVVLMLLAYPKNEQDALTPGQLKQLKKTVEGEYR